MVKKILFISLALLGLLFSTMPPACFADAAAQLEQAAALVQDGHYEQAEAIYQQIVTDYPGTDYALTAQKKIAILDIKAGDDAAAEAALDRLIADFNDQPGLPEVVFVIGEQYYNKACIYKKEGLATKADENFAKAIAVWGKIITELPPSRITPEAYFFSARCYESVGEYENAIHYYSIVVDDWPDDTRFPSTLYRAIRLYEKLESSGQISTVEAATKIRQACKKFLVDYPNSRYAKQLRIILEHWNFIYAWLLSQNKCFGSNTCAGAEPNEQDIQLAKEKMQQLREVYKEVQQAEAELQRLAEEAEREEPLLRPTVEALKDMRDFYENEIKDGQRFQEYLKNSKDRKEAYRLYSDCKGAFVNNKTIQFLSDPNQERLVIKPLLYIYRRLSKETLQESLPGFDPNDPNDERVWQKLKQMYFKRTPDEYLQRMRKYYIEEKGVPEWLPDYAGDMAFADQMINTYETGILLLTPQDVCDAEKRVDNLYIKIGKIYPSWNKMRHLLAGENNPDNEAVIRAVQEHMQIWPTVYRKLTQTKKGRR